MSVNSDMKTHFVESVGECFIATWGRTQDPPEVDNELVTAWRSLALWNRLQRAEQLDGRFEGQGQGRICLCLSSDV